MTNATALTGITRSTSHRDGWSRAGEALLLLLLLAAAGLGLYARFVDLGIRQLAVDEYYFVVSVRSIVEHGLPRLTGGGFYARGLLPQYLTAGSVLMFGDGGFAYRLPAVLFNLAAIVVAYAYARRHLSRPMAAVLPIVLLVSSWEVEFARFARMYAAFQFTTLLLLLVTDRVLAGDRRAARWIPAVVLLNLLTHQMAVVFLPFLVLPAVEAWARGGKPFASPSGRSLYLAGSAVVVGAGYLLGFAALRNFGVANPFPFGFEPAVRGTLRTPDLAFAQGAVIALAAIGALLLYRAVRVYRERQWPTTAAAWAWAALILAAIHSLLPVLVCVLVLAGRYDLRPGQGDREARWVVGLALALAGAWMVILAVASQSSLIRALLGWPNLLDPVVWPWRRELPVLGAVILVALVSALVMNIKKPVLTLLRHPAAIIGYTLVAFGTLDSLYISTRYTFFLYPVALLTVMIVVAEVSRGRTGLGAAVVIALFSFGGDFVPTHLWQVSSQEASWRTGRFQGRAATWYPRQDFKGPAELVESAVGSEAGSAKVIVAGLPPVSEYLDTSHAMFYDRASDPRFANVSRAGGTVDLWSGERLLSTADQLEEYLSSSHEWWLVAPTNQDLPTPIRQALGTGYQVAEQYLSRDGRIRILHLISPSRSSPGATLP